MIDQDPNETAQICGSDFAQMCDEMKQLRAERDALRETAHNNSVFWSARDGTGELQHYKASPAEASKLIVALGNERDRLLSELADERAKKSDALIAAVNDIERLTAENERLATGNHSMEKEIPQLRHAVERLRAALELIATPMRPDGWFERGRVECGIIARKALAAPAQ